MGLVREWRTSSLAGKYWQLVEDGRGIGEVHRGGGLGPSQWIRGSRREADALGRRVLFFKKWRDAVRFVESQP
jgi:hypothetical protein